MVWVGMGYNEAARLGLLRVCSPGVRPVVAAGYVEMRCAVEGRNPNDYLGKGLSPGEKVDEISRLRQARLARR